MGAIAVFVVLARVILTILIAVNSSSDIDVTFIWDAVVVGIIITRINDAITIIIGLTEVILTVEVAIFTASKVDITFVRNTIVVFVEEHSSGIPLESLSSEVPSTMSQTSGIAFPLQSKAISILDCTGIRDAIAVAVKIRISRLGERTHF